jgi:hypothetical protein
MHDNDRDSHAYDFLDFRVNLVQFLV